MIAGALFWGTSLYRNVQEQPSLYTPALQGHTVLQGYWKHIHVSNYFINYHNNHIRRRWYKLWLWRSRLHIGFNATDEYTINSGFNGCSRFLIIRSNSVDSDDSNTWGHRPIDRILHITNKIGPSYLLTKVYCSYLRKGFNTERHIHGTSYSILILTGYPSMFLWLFSSKSQRNMLVYTAYSKHRVSRSRITRIIAKIELFFLVHYVKTWFTSYNTN